MKNILILFALLTFSLLELGCQKQDDGLLAEDTLTVRVNGKTYTTDNVTAKVSIHEGLHSKSLIMSVVLSPTQVMAIGWLMDSVDTSNKCLPLLEATCANWEDFLEFSYASTTGTAYSSGTGDVCRFSITNCDEDRKRLSGTFSTTMEDSNGNIIEFADGVFYDILYTTD